MGIFLSGQVHRLTQRGNYTAPRLVNNTLTVKSTSAEVSANNNGEVSLKVSNGSAGSSAKAKVTLQNNTGVQVALQIPTPF